MSAFALRPRLVFDFVLLATLTIPLVNVALPAWFDEETSRVGPAWRERMDLLARAQVFAERERDVRTVDLSRPIGMPSLDAGQPVVCRYRPEPASGSTPKFDCALPSGEVVKVKYGRTPERSGEVAATRLLDALGFGADRVEFVSTLQCIGCPPAVFRVRQIADLFAAGTLVEHLSASERPRAYSWVTVERKLPGRPVEVEGYKGWAWRELDAVSPGAGGASRADLDAFRLMAVLLAHWDNKDANQRLTCLGDKDACEVPLLMMQDVGATFGPRKVTLDGWRAAPIWQDSASCTVTMASLPYAGSTFVPVEISEEGRRLIVSKLQQLSDQQMTALFRSARVPDARTGEPANDVSPWVSALKAKIAEIAGHAPCPAVGGLTTDESPVAARRRV